MPNNVLKAYIKPELLKNDTELKMQLDIRCKKISFMIQKMHTAGLIQLPLPSNSTLSCKDKQNGQQH
jgi:hypothetical protein